MKKSINISIALLVIGLITSIIMIFNFNILKAKQNTEIVNTTDKPSINSASDDFSNIRIDFEIHTDKDNIIPENLISLQKSAIKEVFGRMEYGDYEFMTCTDIYGAMHIAYTYNGSYYSIGQIDQWSEDYSLEFNPGDKITKFDNVLGYSGVKVNIISGAASNYVCYIAVMDHPFLFLSESLGGDFTEYDIDEEGQKELLAFDGFMYMKVNDNLYKATYNFDKSKILQILFNDETHQYDVFFSDRSKKEYKYDPEQKCLVEIE